MLRRLGAIAFLLATFTVAGAGCKTTVEGGGSGGGGGGGGGGGSGNGGGLHWYTTCGDPVCMTPDGGAMPPAGVSPCTTETAGDACTSEGTTCWPSNSTCGELLICAKSNPKDNPGGCPISRVSHKKDVNYLSDSEVEELASEARTMRLSSWRYKGEADSARPHVGFLIDDMPESVAVTQSGERVDLYGYTSMAIAATQSQDKRLDAMEKELRALREEVTSLRAKATHCEAESR